MSYLYMGWCGSTSDAWPVYTGHEKYNHKRTVENVVLSNNNTKLIRGHYGWQSSNEAIIIII